MRTRRLPVQPILSELEAEARTLLAALHAGDLEAEGELRSVFGTTRNPRKTSLADAQHTLAISYSAPDWNRVVRACQLVELIWSNNVAGVRELIVAHPSMLHEAVLIRESNWGMPMSYAANIGLDEMVVMLHDHGATDLEHALGRASLQGRVSTARLLHQLLGSPVPADDALGGPAYTLSVQGTALLLEFGARVIDGEGSNIAPVSVVLQSDSRNPAAKHAILALYAEHGYAFPITPMMALHRGRLDLLAEHLERDPALLQRTFAYTEIFPIEMGCHSEQLPRTTLHGATLLHACVEFGELEIASWLLDRGMDVDVPAAVDVHGFGGHTALFAAVVSYPNFWTNFRNGWVDPSPATDSPITRLLLARGANTQARASLRETHFGEWSSVAGFPITAVIEHHDVTVADWGNAFQYKMVVSEPALRLIAAHELAHGTQPRER